MVVFYAILSRVHLFNYNQEPVNYRTIYSITIKLSVPIPLTVTPILYSLPFLSLATTTVFFISNFVILRTLYKWNHTVYDFLYIILLRSKPLHLSIQDRMGIPQFAYAFTYWRTFGCVQFLAISNEVAINICKYRFLVTLKFNFSGTNT